MIINPTIGMRVRFIDLSLTNFYGQIGTITSRTIIDSYTVLFDHPIEGFRDWVFHIRRLEPLQLSLEEQEQKRREEHAMRYL